MNRLSKTHKAIEVKLPSFQRSLVENSYVETTNGIEITVWPEFVDTRSNASGDLFIWAYHVRIDNNGAESAKLVNRYWRIIDEKGIVQEITGEGVIGEQPRIKPHSSHQYSSGVHLRNPSGIMSGHYEMLLENGEIFNAKIPAFSLDVPNLKRVIN